MSIALDRFCLIISFKMPNTVELSVRRGVGGCVWPNSVSVTLSGAPLWALRKHAPTSDSAAEATTFLMTEATLRMHPLSISCWGGWFPRNADLRDGFGRSKLISKRHCCECAISCRRRDIGWWRPDEWPNNPIVDSWLLAFFQSPSFVPLQYH
jgi:hypothetical protein